MSYLLVGNPTARSGKAAELIDEALAELRRREVEVELLPTEPHGATILRVCEAIDRSPPQAVLALGGDGTFAEAARGVLLASKRVPLGMLPAGTANDQGKSFGLTPGREGLLRNLDVILAGHLTQLDVGRISLLDDKGEVLQQQPFFDSVGWGMQPEVLAIRNRDRKLVDQIPLVRDVYRDEAVYAGAVLNRYLASWIEPTKFSVELDIDGRAVTLSDLTDVIVKATAVYAGSWVLEPCSRPDDGLFELVPVVGRRDWFVRAVRDLTAVSLLRENLEALGIESGKPWVGAHFQLNFKRPGRRALASQVDGEEWHSGNNFRVDVLPNALPLLTPADWLAPWAE